MRLGPEHMGKWAESVSAFEGVTGFDGVIGLVSAAWAGRSAVPPSQKKIAENAARGITTSTARKPGVANVRRLKRRIFAMPVA